ncbi:Plasmodium exported protein (PHISTa), unknown, putative [Plasmodium sp.]|nr:Plasmodium exported protein (PHISTa), unknown, putative [Plasmodium sp.]
MMKYCCVGYYSEETHIKNTTNACSFRRIFLNFLSIAGILLLNIVLSIIIICAKIEPYHEGVYDIYIRNLSEKNSESSKVNDVKHNDVSSEEKCDNINYNDLSKQLTLEELDNVLDNLEERPSN